MYKICGRKILSDVLIKLGPCFLSHTPGPRTVFWFHVCPDTHHLISARWVHPDDVQLAGEPAEVTREEI